MQALAQLLVGHPVLDDGLELCAEVGDVQCVLADDRRRRVCAGFAVPTQAVWACPFVRHRCCLGRGKEEGTHLGTPRAAAAPSPGLWCPRSARGCAGCLLPHRPVSGGMRREGGEGRRTGEEEHVAFVDVDVPELVFVDDAQQHPALVLVEPLLRHHQRPGWSDTGSRTDLCFVDVVVVALVWAADDHDDKVLAVVRTEVVHRRLQQVLVLRDPFGEVERRWQRHVRWSLREFGTRRLGPRASWFRGSCARD